MDSIQHDLFNQQLKSVGNAVRFAFNQNPEFIDLSKDKKANNKLVKWIWDCVDDFKVEAILREARRLRNNPNSPYYCEDSKFSGMKEQMNYEGAYGFKNAFCDRT